MILIPFSEIILRLVSLRLNPLESVSFEDLIYDKHLEETYSGSYTLYILPTITSTNRNLITYYCGSDTFLSEELKQ